MKCSIPSEDALDMPSAKGEKMPSSAGSAYWDHERSPAAKSHYEAKAVAAIDAQDWHDLAKIAREWISADSNASGAWLLLGYACEKNALPYEALDAYSRAEALGDKGQAAQWRGELTCRLCAPRSSLPGIAHPTDQLDAWLVELHRWTPTATCALLLMALIAWALSALLQPKSVDYYLNRFDARTAKISECQRVEDATKDNECMNAFAATRQLQSWAAQSVVQPK
jgi:hypothetical protein